LTLEEKAHLLTGKTAWRTWALPQIGLREMVFSDGPVGVRGTGESADETSDCLPSPTALAACWDEALAHRVGRWFADQARRHGVDVVLAPVVNLQRVPVGGRHFECLSEDPLLTGQIGAALIAGTQECGVASCVKHYVGNEVETDRTSYISRIDEQTLREVYLAPFERAIRAGAWSVMAAYNRVDAAGEDSWMVAHHHLLVDVLKCEWGFDGPVVSDWTAVRETVPPALGGLDLVMPGPVSPWSDGRLVEAARAGLVPEKILNDKVVRLLWLAERVGALDDGVKLSDAPVSTRPDPTLPRELVARASVVLTNQDDALPLRDPGSIRTIALIGPNATDTRLLGGGSASVPIAHPVSLVDGLKAGFPDAEIITWQGVSSRVNPPAIDSALTRVPGTGRRGVLVEYLDEDERVIARDVITEWSGHFGDELPTGASSLRITTAVSLEPGVQWLGVGTVGRHRVVIDGQLVSQSDLVVGGEVMINSSFNVPPAQGVSVHVDQPRAVTIEAQVQCIETQWGPRARAGLYHRLPGPSEDESIARAARLASEADLAIVVVGTNEETESEGWDRANLDLPGRQDDLVNAVLDQRHDAMILVNAGAPVVMPWLDRARTVVWFWFPGQEAGSGLVDILTGRTEPAGRLPWTLPDAHQHAPIPFGQPDADGVIDYAEGVDVGYRGWLRSGRRPARPFGFGLGWTTWSMDACHVTRVSDDGIEVSVRVTNTGTRRGTAVVQGYLRPPLAESNQSDGGEAADVKRPALWLAAHACAEVDPGQSTHVTLTLERRSFEVWRPSSDAAPSGWTLPRGTYQLCVGHNVLDLPLQVDITWPMTTTDHRP
jgi:beta-glucosidase